MGIGVGVGVAAGLFGVGGGALVTVGLLAVGFRQHAAHATSLAAVVATALAAVVPFALAGGVAPVAALVLAAAAMVGVNLTAGLMPRIPERRLRQLFAVFLLAVAARLVVGLVTPVDGHTAPAIDLAAAGGLALLGLVAGGASAILGVGGGLVTVPALVLLFGFGQHAAEGTSLAMVVPTALVGAWRHSRRGLTDWRAGAVVGLAGVASGVAAGAFVQTVDAPLLQRLFAAFLAIMALRLLLQRERRESPPEPDPAD